jgi:mono/diheme cytochrome c family protein
MSLRKSDICCALWLLLLLFLSGCARQEKPPRPAAPASDSVRASDSAAAAVAAVPAGSYEERQGKALFATYCAVCHGAEGRGDGFNAFNLDPKPRNLADAQYMSALSDERIVQTIREGGRGVNRSALMPSWGARLTGNEILDVVAFVRTLADTSAAK